MRRVCGVLCWCMKRKQWPELWKVGDTHDRRCADACNGRIATKWTPADRTDIHIQSMLYFLRVFFSAPHLQQIRSARTRRRYDDVSPPLVSRSRHQIDGMKKKKKTNSPRARRTPAIRSRRLSRSQPLPGPGPDNVIPTRSVYNSYELPAERITRFLSFYLHKLSRARARAFTEPSFFYERAHYLRNLSTHYTRVRNNDNTAINGNL